MVGLRATPHGWLALLELPAPGSAEAQALVDALQPPERGLIERAAPKRRVSFAGGRAALRAALAATGAPLRVEVPIGRNDRGAPQIPLVGVSASISHSAHLAAALVLRLEEAPRDRVGVDVEALGAVPMEAEGIVLTERERHRLPKLAEARREELAVTIALKEAFFKALDPYVRRNMSWSESEVWPRGDGSARLFADLTHCEGPFEADGRWWMEGRHVFATVRVKPELNPTARPSKPA